MRRTILIVLFILVIGAVGGLAWWLNAARKRSSAACGVRKCRPPTGTALFQ